MPAQIARFWKPRFARMDTAPSRAVGFGWARRSRVGAPDLFSLPYKTDWAWRPDVWGRSVAQPKVAVAHEPTRISGAVTMFHDCALADITLRQRASAPSEDAQSLAPFGLWMNVGAFQGTYLSLVADLPPEVAVGLTKQHILRVDAQISGMAEQALYVRLNICCGPNTEQIVRTLSDGSDTRYIEFDLAYSRLNEKRIDKLWMDLIVAEPAHAQLVLDDLIVSRRPRAAF